MAAMEPASTLDLFRVFGLSILLGALMGLERERAGARIAGMRTFPLISLLGAVTGLLAELSGNLWLLAAGIIGVTALTVTGNLLQARRRPDPGLTTEIAMLIAFGVGALVYFRQAPVAVAVAFAATAILYFKPHLHAFSRKLEQRDLYAVFQFGLVTFIILPVLPNREYGPFAALNPHHIWLMVVLISGISLSGYVVLKLVRGRWGGPLLGLLGGLVSSTAATLAFARRARKNPGISRTAAVVVVLASTVVMVRIAVEVAVVNPALLTHLWLPIVLMFLAGLAMAALAWSRSKAEAELIPETKNPAELTGAIAFGLLYGVALLAVSAGKHFFGSEGVYVVSLISGLTDVDAITLSNARLARTGVLAPLQARNAIFIAILSNLAFKLAAVRLLGTARLARWTALGFAAMALAGLAALFI
jgi:uncharacterized membrane protein (DUF4010 family)